MNINIPRYFIYKDKKNIDDYEVQSLTPQYLRALQSVGKRAFDGPKTMNQRMFEAIENSCIVKLEGADVYALQIFNTAHYITTLLLLEHHPKLYFKTYLRIADEVGGAPGRKNTFHDLFQAMTMAMVCNFLRVLNPRYLNVDDFVKFLNEEFTSRYSTQEAILSSLEATQDPAIVRAIHAQQIFFTTVLSEAEARKYAVNPKHFLPRPIDEALQESNYEDICANIDYIKEHIMELPEKRRGKAVHIVFEKTQQTGREALYGAMSEASQYVWETMQEIFASFGYGHIPPELMGDPEKVEREKYEVEERDDNGFVELQKTNDEIEQLREKLAEAIREKEELAEELKAYMERNQNRRGINRLKTAHLGIILAPKLGIHVTNKKDLAPVLSKLFGWGQNSLEKQMSKFFSKEEELELANIFGDLSPDLAKHICPDWQAPSPRETEAPQPE